MTHPLNIAHMARFYIANIAFVVAVAFLSVIPAGNLLLTSGVTS
jgi:hypothetical protein